MKETRIAEGVGDSIREGWRTLKDFLYGFFLYSMVHEVEGRRRKDESVFFALVMGDLAGVPIYPCYYRLRLLPHCFARLGPWKRNAIRPKDPFAIVSD